MNTTATVFTQTAKEKRTEILAHRDATKGSMKALTGNTWPVKSLLYAYGSIWNKEAKALEVPEHVHAECQAVIDGYEKAHPKTPKAPKADKPAPAKVDRPAVKITTAQVIEASTHATGIPVGKFAARIYNLNMVTDQVATDLLSNGHVEAARLVVSTMAAFNGAHKLLV
jgi:hypothetical protein